MADRDGALRGLAEISEYMKARADVAGVGQVREIFDSWYRAAEDARELIEDADRTGHWQTSEMVSVLGFREVRYRCDNCRQCSGVKSPFCPECGARMEESGDE